jgi:hypothetical protein
MQNGFGFKAIGIKGLGFMWTSSKLIFKSHYIVGNWVPLMHNIYIYDSKFIKKVLKVKFIKTLNMDGLATIFSSLLLPNSLPDE